MKKAYKITYQVLHPGNNKQSFNLAQAIFDETTIAAFKSYFPDRHDIYGFLYIINVWWQISNSKSRYSPSLLNNAVIADDGKPEFLTYFADWLEKWSSESSNFLLTKQTSNALIQTLRAQGELIKELLSDGYLFVMTGRFQSDPIERRFSQY